jgi:zinc transport system permease protein
MDSYLFQIVLGAILISLLLGIYSFVVYFFRLAFLSIAVSNAVLAGLAIGIFFHIDPTLTALLFSLLVGWLIAFVRKKAGLTEDASIGIVLALSMAVGIILIYLSGYQGNIFSYLFGSLLTLSWKDIVSLLFLLLVSVIFIARHWEQILFLCFDEETAYSSGINVNFLYYTIIALLSFLITYSTKLIGVILTHAMLVIPAATVYQIFWHYKLLLAGSTLLSIFSTLAGLALSYFYDLPTGPLIVTVGGILFLLFWVLKIFKIPSKVFRNK